jgi:hypothetical protein
MKYASVRVFAAGLLLSGASLIQAQSPEPPHLMRIFREDIKSGKGAAHEKVESAYARAFGKSGYPSYLALDGTTGTSQAWFLEPQTTLSQLDVQDGELRSGEHGMIATYQKDMSYLPVPSNLAKARYVNINVVRVRPGHVADFAEMRKLVNAAFEKSESKQRRAIYSVSSGMPAGTYLILMPMDSLKAMDRPAGAMSMVEAFGADNLAKYNKLQAETIMSSEFTLFAINPKMSNPPKEFIAADPGF